MSSKKYERYCDNCYRFYKGYGIRYCSKKCQHVHSRLLNSLSESCTEFSSGMVPGSYRTKTPKPEPILANFPAPIQIIIKKKKQSLTKPMAIASVHFSDIHFPFHDEGALNILYQILEEVNPSVVVDHGDTLDCHSISKYEKDPQDRIDYQIEMEMAAEHHGRVHQLTPEARHIWLLGNHEDRLRKLIWKLAESRETEALLKLPGVMAALKWERLTGVEALGWEIVPYPDHILLWDRLLLCHGSTVRKWSSYSAKAEHDRYGKSGMSGHTHRRGVFEHRDYNGFHAWWELGMLGTIHGRYAAYPDWQQGFCVVTWDKDHKTFGVEEVRIHEAQTIFRGKKYKG